jgi:hypothetical protein
MIWKQTSNLEEHPKDHYLKDIDTKVLAKQMS